MKKLVRYLAVVMLLLVGGEVSAQQMKERGWVRRGNRQYEKGEYNESIERYRKALEYDPTSFEAQYDLASALYRVKRYGEAEELLASMLKDGRRSEAELGEIAYNLGNTQFAQEKYEEALSSYRFAMRCNPNDEDAKFNYALTKRKLQQQQQQQQQQGGESNDQQDKKDKKDQQDQQGQQGQQDEKGKKDEKDEQDKKDQQDKKDNQDEKDKQDEQDKQDKKEDKDQQDKKGKKDKQDRPQSQQNKENDGNEQDKQQSQNQNGSANTQQGEKKSESGMTPEQRDVILQAVQMEEDKTQDKLKEKVGVVIKGGKNW